MSKTKKELPELSKPNMKKVREKLLNTAKHQATHPKCAIASGNLARLKTKYPKVAEELSEQFDAILEAA